MLVLLAVGGVGLVGLSWTPFESLKAYADGVSADGDARSYTAERHRRLARSVRGVGCLGAAAGLILWRRRRVLAAGALYWATDIAAAGRELQARLVDGWRREDGFHRAAALLLLGGGVAWRLLALKTPMRGDEAYTVIAFATRPLVVGLSDYSSPNNHLFHTALVHLCLGLFGDGIGVVRLPALAAGTLILPAAYLALRLHLGRQVALLGLAVVAMAPVMIEFSTNARGYTLVGLAFLAILLLAALLREMPRRGLWALIALASALGFGAVPTMVFPFALVVMWIVFSVVIGHRNRQVGRELAGCIVATGLLAGLSYLPVFLASGPRAVIANATVAPRPWSLFLASLQPRLLAVWEDWSRGLPWPLLLVVVAGWCAAIGLPLRSFGAAGRLIAAAVLGCVPLLALLRVDPYSRVWLFLLPVVAGLAFVGPVAAIRRWVEPRSWQVPVAALCVGLAMSAARPGVAPSDETGPAVDGAGAAALLEENLRPGDRVLTTSFIGPALNYSFRRRGLELSYLEPPADEPQRIWLLARASESVAAAARNLDGGAKLRLEEWATPAVIATLPGPHPARLLLLERRPEAGRGDSPPPPR